MKKTIFLATLATVSTLAMADNLHNGYVRGDGTYVAPHYQTDPDSTRSNNYSTSGNTNPYTGASGTKDAYAPAYRTPQSGSAATPTYGQPAPRTRY